MSKYAYTKGLLCMLMFVFLQEHWLHTADMQSLRNLGADVSLHRCSYMLDNILLQGHPYSAVAILWHSECNHFVRPCEKFSARFCAVQVNFNSLKCVYMPTDDQTNSVHGELHDTLDEIETFISSLNVAVILLGGDFNADFTRKNVQSNYVKAFCDRVYLLPCVSFLNHSFTYTRSQGNFYSLFNHFMISNIFDIKKSCVGLELLDDSVVNEVKCSDHDAVLLRLNLPMIMHAHSLMSPHQLLSVSNGKANSAYIVAFKTQLADKLTSLSSSFPIDFLQYHCSSSPLHILLIDKFAVSYRLFLLILVTFVCLMPYFLSVDKILL